MKKHFSQRFFDEEFVMFKEGYFYQRVMDRLAKATRNKTAIGFKKLILPIKSFTHKSFGVSCVLSMAVENVSDKFNKKIPNPEF